MSNSSKTSWIIIAVLLIALIWVSIALVNANSSLENAEREFAAEKSARIRFEDESQGLAESLEDTETRLLKKQQEYTEVRSLFDQHKDSTEKQLRDLNGQVSDKKSALASCESRHAALSAAASADGKIKESLMSFMERPELNFSPSATDDLATRLESFINHVALSFTEHGDARRMLVSQMDLLSKEKQQLATDLQKLKDSSAAELAALKAAAAAAAKQVIPSSPSPSPSPAAASPSPAAQPQAQAQAPAQQQAQPQAQAQGQEQAEQKSSQPLASLVNTDSGTPDYAMSRSQYKPMPGLMQGSSETQKPRPPPPPPAPAKSRFGSDDEGEEPVDIPPVLPVQQQQQPGAPVPPGSQSDAIPMMSLTDEDEAGVEGDTAAVGQQEPDAGAAALEAEAASEIEGEQLDELSEVEQEVETEKLALEDEEKQLVQPMELDQAHAVVQAGEGETEVEQDVDAEEDAELEPEVETELEEGAVQGDSAEAASSHKFNPPPGDGEDGREEETNEEDESAGLADVA
jgi:hypothetical protein